MAVTDIYGMGGNFAATGFNGDFRNWSVSVNVDTAVYAAWSSRWKRSKLLTGNVTGSAEAVVQFDAANTAPLLDAGGAIDIANFSASVTFTATTGCTITGTFNFTNCTLNRSIENEMTMVANVESDGTVNITWDEA